jgi:pimeloyl-ACP methyl ester carboxylesterase
VPTATINGFELAYERRGNGPPVVFVHGGFGGITGRLEPARQWWVDELFAPHFTVVTYDRRACGRSGIPDEGYTIETFAEDLHGLLQHLGISTSYVIGSSAGGPIALEHALTHPDAVRGLVLVNTAPDLLTGEQSQPLRERLAAQRAAGPDALPELAEGADPESYQAAIRLRELIRQLPAEERRQAFEGWDRTVRAYETVNLTPRLHQLTMPVYILHGRADEVVPAASAYKLSNDIPRSSARIMSGERHGLLARRESGAAEYILEWLLAQAEQPA